MTDEKARWDSVRAAIGVMRGKPADAIADTEALHDEPAPAPCQHDFGRLRSGHCWYCGEHSGGAPPNFRFTPLPVDLFPEYIICSTETRLGPNWWRS